MANTIGTGTKFRIPYYANTGTDLTSTVFLYYSPTSGVFTANGTADIFRGSERELLTLGHYQGAAAANDSITITRSRGSSTARTAVAAGDTIGNIKYNAVTNSSGNVALAGGIRMVVDTGTVSAGSLNSKFMFSTRRGATELTSLIITSESTSTSVGTGGVQIPQGGLGVNGSIYAGNIFTNGTRVSTFDGAYSSLSGKPTVPTNLDSLTDVTVSSPTTGQVLKYNGTTWVNDADATGGGGGGGSTFSDTIKTSKGNLTLNFDIDGSGTVNSNDALTYAKIGATGKLITGAPVLTPHTWIEGSWGTTTSSHAVIAVVEGNAINALKTVVGSPLLETGDTMFMGNVDAGQRAANGFFVGGEQVGMFAYDNNGEQNATTSTMKIVSSTNGTGRWDISASGGVRVANTLTVAGGIIASTGFIQTRNYADTAARDTAIPTPVAGMMVLCAGIFQGYNGTAWVAMSA